MTTGEPSGPLRVACFAHLSEVSGAGVALVAMAGRLDRGRFEALVVAPEDGPIVERARREGVERVVVVRNVERSMAEVGGGATARMTRRLVLAWGRVGYVARVWRWLRREKIDVAYVASAASVFAGVGAWLARVPVAWHVHEPLDEASLTRGLRWKLWVVGRVAAGRLFASRSALESFHRVARGAREVPEVVAKNLIDVGAAGEGEGVSAGLSVEERRAVEESLGIGAEDLLVISNGVIPRKGPDVGIEAFGRACLAGGVGKARLVLLGGSRPENGEFVEGLRRMATEVGGGDAVIFAGARGDVGRLLKRADLYVSPSRSEAMPIALVEAMGAGVPVVATDTGDCRELLGDGKLGVVVPVEDVEGLAGAIRAALWEKRGEALERAARAREIIAREYSVEGVMGPIEEVIGRVAGRV